MKQNHITRRAFALSSIALAAFGLSSFATVAAAEPPIPKPDGKPAGQRKQFGETDAPADGVREKK